MVSQNILAGTLLSLSLAAASLVPLQQLPDVGLMARNLELITPKVFILNGDGSSAGAFYAVKEFDLLAVKTRLPGLAHGYSQVHCTSDREICQLTTGEGGINAAASVMALLASQEFDFRKTYFLLAGLAGINPAYGTLGSVTFARYEVEVSIQYEFDIRDLDSKFSTGYIPLGAKKPSQYPTQFYGTEVYEVSESLRAKAMKLASKASLTDVEAAATQRKRYPYAPANQAPGHVACDGATSDNWFTGPRLGEAFGNFTKLITNGAAVYCSTGSEDSAKLESLLRAARVEFVDFSRIILMRSGANFDRPPPGIKPYDFFFYTDGGITSEQLVKPSLTNLAAAGASIIQGIINGWKDEYEKGIPKTNYIGGIYGTLGGTPGFGPNYHGQTS